MAKDLSLSLARDEAEGGAPPSPLSTALTTHRRHRIDFYIQLHALLVVISCIVLFIE